jgi:hypothetical protein
MDDFDTGGSLSASSEGYADIAGIYRLQASCVGHGFSDASGTATCGLTLDGTGSVEAGLLFGDLRRRRRHE